MYEFIIYWKLLGGHVHMRVFCGKPGFTKAKCGDLVMREEEFDEFRKEIESPYVDSIIEFKEETT